MSLLSLAPPRLPALARRLQPRSGGCQRFEGPALNPWQTMQKLKQALVAWMKTVSSLMLLVSWEQLGKSCLGPYILGMGPVWSG